MPAIRKTTDLLTLSGSVAHNPKRHAHRKTEPVPTEDIGNAPTHFTADLKKIFKELIKIAPPGVLKNSDRWIVEALCHVMLRVRKGTFSNADLSHLRSGLASLGMTPADRSRVSVTPTKKSPDPHDEWTDIIH